MSDYGRNAYALLAESSSSNYPRITVEQVTSGGVRTVGRPYLTLAQLERPRCAYCGTIRHVDTAGKCVNCGGPA